MMTTETKIVTAAIHAVTEVVIGAATAPIEAGKVLRAHEATDVTTIAVTADPVTARRTDATVEGDPPVGPGATPTGVIGVPRAEDGSPTTARRRTEADDPDTARISGMGATAGNGPVVVRGVAMRVIAVVVGIEADVVGDVMIVDLSGATAAPVMVRVGTRMIAIGLGIETGVEPNGATVVPPEVVATMAEETTDATTRETVGDVEEARNAAGGLLAHDATPTPGTGTVRTGVVGEFPPTTVGMMIGVARGMTTGDLRSIATGIEVASPIRRHRDRSRCQRYGSTRVRRNRRAGPPSDRGVPAVRREGRGQHWTGVSSWPWSDPREPIG